MKTTLIRLSSALLAVSLLAGCANSGMGQKQTGGAMIGGAAGALAGAQFGHGTGKLAATAIGTLLGAYVGSEAGKSLDRADQAYYGRAEQQAHAAPIGQTIHWNNPQSGNSGTFTPLRDGTDTGGNYCREYQSTVMIGGQPQQSHGIACRQPDGSWRIMN